MKTQLIGSKFNGDKDVSVKIPFKHRKGQGKGTATVNIPVVEALTYLD